MKLRRIILASACLVMLAVIGFSLFHRVRIMSTFDKVNVGDKKETVVLKLGQPDEVENCHDSPSVEEPNRCVETYWYKSFLERWGFSFNKDGKVVDKTNNVSF
jgi:hypothetical protein